MPLPIAAIAGAVSLIGGLFKKKKGKTATTGTLADKVGDVVNTAQDVVGLFKKKNTGFDTGGINPNALVNPNKQLKLRSMNETVNIFGMNVPKTVAYIGGAFLAYILAKKLRIIR